MTGEKIIMLLLEKIYSHRSSTPLIIIAYSSLRGALMMLLSEPMSDCCDCGRMIFFRICRGGASEEDVPILWYVSTYIQDMGLGRTAQARQHVSRVNSTITTTYDVRYCTTIRLPDLTSTS